MVFQGNRWCIMAIGVLTVLLMISSVGYAQEIVHFSPDRLALQGRWVRTDAPYVIELRQSKDNMLQAKYFNPLSVHVEKTEIAERDGLVFVMIELQDVNYSGSIYLVAYDRAQDALNGVYIHGSSGQRYDVSFSRQRTL